MDLSWISTTIGATDSLHNHENDNSLLNEKWLKTEIKQLKAFLNPVKINTQQRQTYGDTIKAVFTGKFIAISA